MALQGSIDTFALDDVLRLVASTAKSGRLSLRGNRGEGELVVLEGRVLDGSVSTDNRVADLNELVFELLRFEDGEFQFDAEPVEGIADVEPVEVEGLLNGAFELLAEWREIERVVPTGHEGVNLRPEGPGSTVKIEPAQWRVIAAVGGGAGIAELSERLDASNLTIGRLLRSLVQNGLVSVTEGVAHSAPTFPAPSPDETTATPIADPPPAAPVDPAPEMAPFSTDDPWGGSAPLHGTNGNGSGPSGVDADILFDAVGTDTITEAPGADSYEHEHEHEHVHEDVQVASVPVVDAAEFARRLAELPPRAAKAVAAAARATSADEREAALAELDGTGEEVDHEVLLQLLGPVDG